MLVLAPRTAYIFTVFFPPLPFLYQCHGSIFRSVCTSFVALMLFLPVCLPDGAAMRAGVQTGDRIIKVLCSFASVCLHFLSQGQQTGWRLPSGGQSAFLLCLRSCGFKAQPRKLPVGLITFFALACVVLQVNGTLVTHSNHIEVVKLIKCKWFCLFSLKIHWMFNLKSTLTLSFLFPC